jgi:hypothetical protein
MRVLVACEYSGAVRDAFIRRGHTAVSCDLLPTEVPGPHHRATSSPFSPKGGIYLMIAHPPCTYLAVSGMHWTTRGYRDPQLTEDALDFVKRLMDAPIPRIAIENPVSVISTRIRKPEQTIQPWQFGHDASKRTCLWLKGLPPLEPTCIVAPGPNGRYANQDANGQNNVGCKDRWKERSRTYSGIADAMAKQWGEERITLW